MDDDYELLPHDEIESLRHEVEKLKKSPFPDSKENETLLSSMKILTTSINKLIKIFEGAQEDIIKEYSEASPTKLLKEISQQNAKIAEGIVALAKLVKTNEQTSSPRPASPQLNNVPPVSGFAPETEIKTNVPPPNFSKREERKGLFDSFKK